MSSVEQGELKTESLFSISYSSTAIEDNERLEQTCPWLNLYILQKLDSYSELTGTIGVGFCK